MNTDDDTRDIIHIAKQDCLSCLHLIPLVSEGVQKDCITHEHCPAKTMRIVISPPIEKIAKSIVDAEREKNYEKLSKIYAKISKDLDPSLLPKLEAKISELTSLHS
jgi:hypothetical protein